MPRSQGLIPDPKRVRQLENFYGVMANRIQRELLKFDVESYSEVGATALQKEVRLIVNDMNIYAVKWADAATPEAYLQANRIATVRLNILGKNKDPLYNEKIHKHTVDLEADSTADNLIMSNNSINKNVDTYIYLINQGRKATLQIQAWDLRDEEVIAGLLDDTVKSGGTQGDLQRLIRLHFNREIREQKYININGRNYNLIKYAENVARTRLRTVQSRGIENTCIEYDNDLVEISDHGSEFIDICLEFEGNTYSIGGKTPGYKTLSQWPPFHNQCEHSATPTSITAQEARRQFPAGGV